MDFRRMDLDDIEIIRPFFSQVASRTCDFTVGGMFMWRTYYRMEYLIEEDTFFSTLKDEGGTTYFNLPVSEHVEEAIAKAISRFYDKETGIRFCTVPEEYLSCFLRQAPHAVVTEQPDYFDYLYSASDLREMRGSKYHSQRNLIRQFERANPNGSFVPLDSSNLPQVIEFFTTQYAAQATHGETAEIENQMVMEVLHNLDRYGFVGGALTVEGRVIGFSLGEILHDTLFTHVEKADRAYKGAYQYLTQQFACLYGNQASYINREEDMGDAGLRRAKEAYHPITRLKKYIVEVI